VDIENNLLIKIKNQTKNQQFSTNNSFNDNIDNCISLTINYNKENNNFNNQVYLIKIIKNKLRIYSIIHLDQDGKIINETNILKFRNFKIKSKAKLEINNKNKNKNKNKNNNNNNNNNKNQESEYRNIQEIKNIIKLIENNIFNNFPIFFFYKHIYQDLNNYIETNNKHIQNKLDVFLKSNNKDLISTFAYLLTKNKTGKNIFNVLHFDHLSGYIVNNLNIKTYLNNADRKDFTNTKLDENFRFCSFIFNELNIFKETNNNMNQSKNLIQLSLNILGLSLSLSDKHHFKGISSSRKNKLFKLLDKIEAKINIKFEIIDLAKYRSQECLQLFYIIYNNNPNTNIDIIIKNYNDLIAKRIKTIKNSYI